MHCIDPISLASVCGSGVEFLTLFRGCCIGFGACVSLFVFRGVGNLDHYLSLFLLPERSGTGFSMFNVANDSSKNK